MYGELFFYFFRTNYHTGFLPPGGCHVKMFCLKTGTLSFFYDVTSQMRKISSGSREKANGSSPQWWA